MDLDFTHYVQSRNENKDIPDVGLNSKKVTDVRLAKN